ncbi:MAG: DUF4387 domain-containing protein [Pseudomonadota bacterium]
MSKLKDLAQVIRSKNSGPFEITFDVMFDDLVVYRRVADSGVLTPELICGLYGVEPEDIVALLFFEPALAFKFTLRRGWPQGSIAERDTFGAQQYAPLLEIEIPDS